MELKLNNLWYYNPWLTNLNGAMCPKVKRFFLIKNQPKVNLNHLFQRPIFYHVAYSNVIYQFLMF